MLCIITGDYYILTGVITGDWLLVDLLNFLNVSIAVKSKTNEFIH